MGGEVVNRTGHAVDAKVTVRIQRTGAAAKFVGKTAVRVPANASAGYTVAVKLPGGLSRGNYYLAACTPSGTGAGDLGCASSQKDIRIDGGTPVRGSAAQLPKLATGAKAAQAETCTSGAHTLAQPGERVYPDIGNGGYASVHSDVFINYDAMTNLFLPGTHVDLQQRSTQCLSDFSLDFDRHNSITSTTAPGPDFTVASITVNGQPATFKFVQPTYPGDPNGQDDPDPLAHRTGLVTPINADNPNPPACPPTSSGGRGAEHPVRRHQARDHAVGADPQRHRLQRDGQLHRPPGRPPVADRHRGLVPQRHGRRRGRDGHLRADRHGGVDPAQQPPVGQADVRHLRHGHQGQAGDRPGPPGQLRRQRGGRQLPRRLHELSLEVLGADRELPGREQRRQLRLLVPHRRQRRRLLRGAGLGDRGRPQGPQQERDGPAGSDHALPGAVQRAVPVQLQRHRRRAPARELRGGDADEDRLRRRHDRRQRGHAERRARSRTRTCTSGGATTSPRARPS